MQIAQVIGGYTLGAADLLRRAMGKKKPEEMAQQRDVFVAGAEKGGLSRARATQLFDLMEKFAGYGFNRSHAAAYALVAFQTAWLKTHHLAAFMAANLSAVMDDTDKVRIYYEDGVANGLTVLPPDINASGYRFLPVDRNTVRYGLGAIRGSGASAIKSIVSARAVAPFRDLFDFCRRVDKRLVNRRAIEALVRAGCFDALEPNRAALLASVGMAVGAADQAERQAAQNSLFGESEADCVPAGAAASVKPWDMRQQLTEEKAALGFYLSGHLFSVYAPALEGFPRTALAKLQPSDNRVWMAGIVAQARTQVTRRGKMLVVTLDDGTAQIEITVFSELYDRNRDKLKEDALLVALGKVQRDDFSGGVRVSAEEVFDLASLRERHAARLRIAMNGQADAKRLMDMLGPYRVKGGNGSCSVTVHYENEVAGCDIVLGEAWRVRPDERLLASLSAWLQPQNVRVIYSATGQGS